MNGLLKEEVSSVSQKKLVGVVLVSALIGGVVAWSIQTLILKKKMPEILAGIMAAQQRPPAAVVAEPVTLSALLPADEYIAQVEPVEDVAVRCEVSGTIDSVHFTEGSLVSEGDVLFSIDPRPYQAALDSAKADLFQAQKLVDRMKKADARSISASDQETATAGLMRAQAAYDMALVNLDYTQIKAPVSGRIGAADVTKGNYVTPGTDMLARIVQIDPIRVTFSMTDREYIGLRRREMAGDGSARIAQIQLADGSIFPRVGTKDFDDNAINPQTGTLSVRYLFDNADGLLIPGGFVTALLRSAEPAMGIRIPQKALLVDKDGTYVLTVDAEGTVGTARISVGKQVESDIIVVSGLSEGDRVIVEGVQKAQPGATVTVTLVEGQQ
jgi:RND family efflux transporter MFP subunit